MTWRHFKDSTSVETTPVSAMDSATAGSMQGKKYPICARARDDPRIQRFRMMDGRQQAQQKLRHEKLFEEGRRNSTNPKPKEPEEGPYPGMHAAMARFDALWQKKPAAVVEAEAEGESGFGKGMFGGGEIVFCEVAAQLQTTFQEFHDYQTYLFINPVSYCMVEYLLIYSIS